MALGLESGRDRSDTEGMTTHPAPSTQHPAPSDAWRDVWTDPDTARINARMAEVRHDTDDMAEFYAMARQAVS